MEGPDSDKRAVPTPVTTNSIPLSSEHGGRCTVCGGLLSLNIPVEAGQGARFGGAAAVIGGLLATRFLGCFGVLTFAFSIAASAALYRALATRPKCTQCGRIAPREELSTALRDQLDASRRRAILGAAGLGALAIVMLVLWLGAAAALLSAT